MTASPSRRAFHSDLGGYPSTPRGVWRRRRRTAIRIVTFLATVSAIYYYLLTDTESDPAAKRPVLAPTVRVQILPPRPAVDYAAHVTFSDEASAERAANERAHRAGR